MGAFWGPGQGCFADPHADDPLLVKLFDNTWVPEVVGRPAQAFSVVCPPPPPPQNQTPPEQPPPLPPMTILTAAVLGTFRPDGSLQCPPVDPTLTEPPPGSRFLGRNSATLDVAYMDSNGVAYIFLFTYDVNGNPQFSQGQRAQVFADMSAAFGRTCRAVSWISILT